MGLGSQNYIMFMPDGSSQDTLGNLNSGIVYLGRPGELWSMRAVTVLLPAWFLGASCCRRRKRARRRL